MGLLAWTILNRAMLRPEAPFNLGEHKYLRDVYDWHGRERVVCKAAQVGASEMAISYALWSADIRNATVLYLFPTERHVSDFSTARIGPAIEASPYLQSIVGGGPAEDGGRKRGADQVQLKRVRDRFIYLRGSQVREDDNSQAKAAQLKSIDADVVVFDELDEMDNRAPEIALKRLGHSRLAECLWVSTPTYSGFGIHEKYQKSDCRQWFVACPHCGNRQPVEINDVVIAWDDSGRPLSWHETDGHAWPACRRCHRPVDRLADGEWVPEFPGRSVEGFRISKLFCPAGDIDAILQLLQSSNETRRSECFNQDLAMPYVPKGAKLTTLDLDNARRDYNHGPVDRSSGVLIYAGIEAGVLLHMVSRTSVNAPGGSRQLFAGAVESFEEVGVLLRRYGVRRAIIDGLPETRKARELQAALGGGIVFLAYYTEETKNECPVRLNEKDGVAHLDRTRTLDDLVSGIMAGSLTLPAGAAGIPNYYTHMMDSVRVVNESHGVLVARYISTGHDHFFHAENLCRAAMSVAVPAALPAQRGLMKAGQWD